MPGLHHTYDTLREEIGFSLGWGSVPSGWGPDEIKRIESAIREGTSKFLWGFVAPGTGKVYQWSFLRQTFGFTTASAIWDAIRKHRVYPSTSHSSVRIDPYVLSMRDSTN